MVLFILLPALSYADPAIKFESETHDFGTVKQGAQLEFAFEFTNTGTDELVIKRMTPS
jgi:hypothetical protein